MSYLAEEIHLEAKEKGKRQVVRLEASEDFLVEFKYGIFAKKNCIGYGQDLSEEGILFSTFIRPRKGDKLDLNIYFSPKFSGPRKGHFQAQVVRVYRSDEQGPFRVGCRLLFNEWTDSQEIVRQFAWWLHLEHLTRQPLNNEDVGALP